MDTIFMNSENSKTSEPYILILNLTDKLDLRRGEIEYSDNYSKTSGSLWQYCKEIPAVNNAGSIIDFTATNTTDSYKFKTKMTVQTNNDGEINGVEIMVPLKYLSNFWRALEMPLIDSEVEPILTWSENCVIISTNVADQILHLQ